MASPQTLSSSPLPLDGSPATTSLPPPGGESRITLSGELRFEHTDELLDGRYADQPDSLLQIEPGQWRLVESDSSRHQYTFVPDAPLTGSATVQLNTRALIDKYILPPSEVQRSLSGEITVELVHVPAEVPAEGSSPLFMAGVGLAMVAAMAALARAVKRRRAVDADLKRTLEQIRSAARAVQKGLETGGDLTPKARERVGQLLTSAEALADSAKAVRRKLERAGWTRIQTELERIRASSAPGGDALQEQERLAAMLSPLAEEERALTGRLERIRATLDTLRVASVTLDSQDTRDESRRAEELLETVDREIDAAIATQQELRRIT